MNSRASRCGYVIWASFLVGGLVFLNYLMPWYQLVTISVTPLVTALAGSIGFVFFVLAICHWRNESTASGSDERLYRRRRDAYGGWVVRGGVFALGVALFVSLSTWAGARVLAPYLEGSASTEGATVVAHSLPLGGSRMCNVYLTLRMETGKRVDVCYEKGIKSPSRLGTAALADGESVHVQLRRTPLGTVVDKIDLRREPADRKRER